jgi:hypothetical protein
MLTCYRRRSLGSTRGAGVFDRSGDDRDGPGGRLVHGALDLALGALGAFVRGIGHGGTSGKTMGRSRRRVNVSPLGLTG